MSALLTIMGALLSPLLALGLLLWLARLEDTLPRDVRRAAQRPDPPPILAMPVRPPAARAPMARAPVLPQQRVPEPSPAPAPIVAT